MKTKRILFAARRLKTPSWVRHLITRAQCSGLAGIPTGCFRFGIFSGGIATLNHRLMASMPSASCRRSRIHQNQRYQDLVAGSSVPVLQFLADDTRIGQVVLRSLC